MSNLLEVLVTSDSNNTMWTSCVLDPHTGTNLMTYKGGGTAEMKTLSFIGNDYIAAVEKNKPILHIWPLNSHQTVQGMRFILPGKANAFSFTKDGSFCVAGIDEKIYLWQMASGNLLTILNRHYQKINLIKFTSDGRYFVSAAEDGMVMVWSLTAIATHPEVDLVTQTTAGQHDPVYIISDHSLPVTDLCVSKTGLLGRLCTVSSDRTCKIYDLTTGEMLLNLVFDVPLSSVAMDVLELAIFVGTSEGSIYECSLVNPVRNKDVLMSSEMDNPSFSSHTSAVTFLSASVDGETLMSASNDEQVILWHIKSKQPIKTMKHKGPITNAFFTLNLNAIYKQDFKPKIVIHSLERTLEKDADEVTELEILVDKKINFWPKQQGHTHLHRELHEPSTQSELEFKDKEEALQREIENLKNINASLYTFTVQKTLDNVKTVSKIDPIPLTPSTTFKKKKRKQKTFSLF